MGFSISVPLAFLQKQKKCLCILGVIKILSKFLLIKKNLSLQYNVRLQ